nr:cobamide remodeling phosphodiesterase CbiR [Ardenticatena sp.]
MRARHFPFRLGSTSYVVRGDLVTNAYALRHVVDDIELVLFDTGQMCNYPTANEMHTLARLAALHGLTFSLHLPTHLALVHHEAHVRRAAIREAVALIQQCAALPLSAVVVHLDGGNEPAGTAAWQAWAYEALIALRDVSPAPLCVENLENAPCEAFVPVVEGCGVAYCLDVGHVWKLGGDPVALWRRWWPRLRVVHLHAVAPSGDHASLDSADEVALRRVVCRLVRYGWRGVLTLEVYEEDFWRSRDVLERLLAHGECGTLDER